MRIRVRIDDDVCVCVAWWCVCVAWWCVWVCARHGTHRSGSPTRSTQRTLSRRGRVPRVQRQRLCAHGCVVGECTPSAGAPPLRACVYVCTTAVRTGHRRSRAAGGSARPTDGRRCLQDGCEAAQRGVGEARLCEEQAQGGPEATVAVVHGCRRRMRAWGRSTSSVVQRTVCYSRSRRWLQEAHARVGAEPLAQSLAQSHV